MNTSELAVTVHHFSNKSPPLNTLFIFQAGTPSSPSGHHKSSKKQIKQEVEDDHSTLYYKTGTVISIKILIDLSIKLSSIYYFGLGMMIWDDDLG